jgi:hypothetical protein
MELQYIDKKACNLIRDELDAVIEKKLAEMGLEGGLGNARYDDANISFKFEVRLKGELTQREKDHVNGLWYYAEVKSSDFGATPEEIRDSIYLVNDEKFKLVGYNSRAKKRPLIMERVADGQKYQVPETAIERHYAKKNKTAEATI